MFAACAILPAACLMTFAQADLPRSAFLESPRDFQVFQRQTKESGEVLVAGQAPLDCERIEARLSGTSSFGRLPVKWEALSFDRQSGAFHGNVGTPAGGWYRFELRVIRNSKPAAAIEIAHVGVGEVFVVAGQSNATNYGEIRQETHSGMVAAFGTGGWRVANDPQPGVQDGSKNGSFIPSFGDAIYERFHVPVGVAAVGHGSTSVRQWLPKGSRFDTPPTMGKFVSQVGEHEWECDGTLFEGMMKAIGYLGRSGFRALLWHQGESDSHQQPQYDIPAHVYRQLLERLIRASRERAGWDFPWFVAQASYHTPDDPSCLPIREMQAALWYSGIALEGPDTDRLTGLNRQNGGRGVHFSDQGLQAHGQLWAAKVGAYLDSVLK
jgi:Carbohydrate esterase, sialic acid-specific acetylesterase